MTIEKILGYSLVKVSLSDFISLLVEEIAATKAKKKSCKWLACLNPHSYVIAKRDKRFMESLKSSDWLIPDGFGILLASRILGGNISMRITGCDVFIQIMNKLEDIGGKKVFFLGSTEYTLNIIQSKMSYEYPNVVVETFSPPFKEDWSTEEQNVMVNCINKAQPDILWVGMTAPKQEKWIYENIFRLNVPFVAAIGAVFDFYAGNIKRSHPYFQHLGLEWLPRLLQEPRRLWKRMLLSAPIFMWGVVKALIFRK